MRNAIEWTNRERQIEWQRMAAVTYAHARRHAANGDTYLALSWQKTAEEYAAKARALS